MEELYKRYSEEFKELEQEFDVKKEPWNYYTLAVLYELVELLDTELESVADLKDYLESHHLRDFVDVGDYICEGEDALHMQILRWLEEN